MYRDVKSFKSFLLGDDNGDYYATLSMGYAKDQDRPFRGLGVDYLYDINDIPDVNKGLTLYFRADHKKRVSKYGSGWRPFWWFSAGATWPKCKASEVTDVLRDPYGTCKDRYICIARTLRDRVNACSAFRHTCKGSRHEYMTEKLLI